MTKEQGQSDTKADTTTNTERAKESGDAAAALVGDMPSGRKMPVILFSVAWVAWIIFLVCMMAM